MAFRQFHLGNLLGCVLAWEGDYFACNNVLSAFGKTVPVRVVLVIAKLGLYFFFLYSSL